MNFIKKTAILAFILGLIAQSSALADNKYWQEFKQFKENPSYNLVFDRDAVTAVKAIAKDLQNAKQVGFLSRFMRPVISMVDGVVVTAETMPMLYGYIDTLCKNNNIATPVITVTQNKGIFNAAAQKILMTTGAIFIGQDMLKELTDDGIEAIVAHEIGHIKYNHVNKMLALSYARLFVLHSYFKNTLSPNEIIALHLTLPFFLIGKRFERQADEFACRQAGRAEGIVSSFEYMLKKEKKQDADFVELYSALQKGSSEINLIDTATLWTRYYLATVGHQIGRGIEWMYHNTILGAHPSHEARIESAKRILAEEASLEEVPAA